MYDKIVDINIHNIVVKYVIFGFELRQRIPEMIDPIRGANKRIMASMFLQRDFVSFLMKFDTKVILTYKNCNI